MKSIAKLLIVVSTFLVLLASAHAAPSAPAPLPPAAQEALDKGIIAAKVPDYLLAIRYFEEARTLAPDAPVVYLNMGLAESRIPGRELRAMAWFGAYLSAYPDAPNAAAVKEQIGVLEVRNKSNVSRLIKAVQDAASQLSNSTKYDRRYPSVPILSFEKRDGLRSVIELWAETGDITVAISITNLFEDDDDKSYMRYVVSKIQAEDGDIAGAQKTADLIPEGEENKSNAQKDIAIAQAKSGDIAGAQKTLVAAQKTAELIQNKGVKDRAQQAIAEAQAKVGITTMRQPTSDAQPQAPRTITVSDWLLELGIVNYGSTRGIFPRNLNEAPFLDLTNHLLSLKASLPSKIALENLKDEIFRRSEAKIYFDEIYAIAKTIVRKQIHIQEKLKRQAKK